VDARRLVAAVGITAINQALQELPQQTELRNRAGWVTWRAKSLATGAAPLPKPLTRAEQELAKHRRDYERIHGTLRRPQ
jgi:hypothetical protein